MALLKLESPQGMVPRADARALPAQNADLATNCNLRGGNLRAVRKPLGIATLTHDFVPRTLFKHRKGAESAWLAWAGRVSVCRSPIQGDELARLFFTGDGEPRVTSWELATGGAGTGYPLGWYALGVPEPVTAPTLAPSGGSSGGEIDYSYCYTFYTQWGEESGRSPATVVTLPNKDGTVTVSGVDTGPANSGAVVGATWAGGYATVQTAAPHWLRAGHGVGLSGVLGAVALNGDFTVFDVVDATHFRVALAAMGAYVSGGFWARAAPYNTDGLLIRVYRSVGTTGAYFRVADVAPSAFPWAEMPMVAGVIEALQDTVARTSMPPGDLRGLALLPGGVLAGVDSTNGVWFSEPNQPHSWPIDYQNNIDYTPVGVGALQNGAIVLTQGKSYLVQGSSPLSYSFFPQEPALPCVSLASVASIPDGVLYQTGLGLALANQGGVRLLTQDYWDDRAWRAMAPGPMRAMFYAGQYVALWDGGGIMLEPGQAPVLLDVSADALYLDEPTGLAFVGQGMDVRQWDAGVPRLPYVWRSKRFITGNPVSFSVLLAEREIPARPGLAAANAAIAAANALVIAAVGWSGAFGDHAFGDLAFAGDSLEDIVAFADEEAGTFRLFRDGVLAVEVEIADRKPRRFKPPDLATDWQVEIVGTLTLGRVAVASNVAEVRGVG